MKYNRINLLLMTVIFFFSCIAYYIFINHYILSEVDDEIGDLKTEIIKYVNDNKRLPAPVTLGEMRVYYTETQQAGKNKNPIFFQEYDPSEKSEETFRKLVFFLQCDSIRYQATILKHLEGANSLIRIIVFTNIGTLLLIILVSSLFNMMVLRKLWRPFYRSMNIIQHFVLGRKQGLNFPKTDIDEFNFMNHSLQEATSKAENDYYLLKEFTENASHEIQTPLAIIRSKLDILTQDGNLTEKQSEILLAAYSSIKKLSRLSQSLLLIPKIGNKQFDHKSVVNLRDKIEEKIAQFNELWLLNNLQLDVQLENASVDANPELMDILLNNLLGNATRHNQKPGSIIIQLHHHLLTISNSGAPQSLNTKKIFTRFYKESNQNEHNGLGLSIVRQICEVSSMAIQYRFANNLHTFELSW